MSPAQAPVSGRDMLLAAVSERQWQEAQVVTWAERTIYHTFDSRKSAGGFPDLVLLRPGQPVVFEAPRGNAIRSGMRVLAHRRLHSAREVQGGRCSR